MKNLDLKLDFSFYLLSENHFIDISSEHGAVDKMKESADDITAADTAPSPTNETHSGVRY